ncbi:hypothetical protein TWF730_002699 [Orbilia blumenaviensis]|uniref:Uncharacterized protein n=1 Tax=Orbilia blumenaviensis TaxID=1796055 RepID=A0AAV9UB97_9PEZI
MSLEGGIYTIKCKLQDDFVGRHLVEDRSLNPKPVYALVDSTEPPQWLVEKSEEGYLLCNRGGHATTIESKLFAVLGQDEALEKWAIEAQPHQGDNLYTIKKTDDSAGWIQTTEVGTEPDSFVINVGPLTVRESLPVQYLPSSLFEFVPVIDIEQ